MKATICDKCRAIVEQGKTYYRLLIVSPDKDNLDSADDYRGDWEICMECEKKIQTDMEFPHDRH